jgi:hypothetical protein
MTPVPVLRLVSAAERHESEQLLLRPFFAMSEAATEAPAVVKYGCRRKPIPRTTRRTRGHGSGETFDLFVDRVLRPRTFGECSKDPGPCPWLLCRHHLAVDVGPRGALKVAFPGRDVDELAETCSLRAADRGAMTTEEIARLLNVTPERISQISMAAERKYALGVGKLRVYQDLVEGEWR